METAYESMEIMSVMVKEGLQNSISDAGVGVLCAKTAVTGAYFNVRINAKDIKDRKFVDDIIAKANVIYKNSLNLENEIVDYINSKI